MTRRLFAVVLHGLGPYYLEPLLRENRLPNIQAILQQGCRGKLLSPYPVSAAAWVTMFTGQSAGVHGALDYVQVDARSYHGTWAQLADTAEFRDDTIFSVLSRRGLRVAALFLPMTYPPWEVEGIMISGFPVPDERRPPTYPPSLSKQIGEITGARLLSLRYEDKDAIEGYIGEMLARIEEITVSTWTGDDYDLMYTCIPVPDLAHHYFWTRDDPSAFERLHSVYERVDATIGRYADLVDDETYFLIFSDHGGGPAPTRRFNVNRWLVERDLLRFRSKLVDRLGVASGVNRLVETVRRHRLHDALRGYIRGPVRQGVLSLTRNDAFVDWTKSLAYGVDFFYPLVGVEINVRGRQSRGVVAPGAEYERLRDQIRDGLEGLVDPATGRKVCRQVALREEMFHGPYLERIPDVVAVLDLDFDGKVQLEPEVFSENTLQWDYPYMGYHSREGFFAARGPGIAPGSTSRGGDMVHLAPTLLELMGVPVPDSMEGESFFGGSKGQ